MSILRHLNKHHGWYDGKRTPFGGGGGPSGGSTTTSQSNQYSNLSPWASPYIGSILGAAQQQVFNMSPGQSYGAVPAQYDSNGNLVSGTGTAAYTAAPTINGINPYSAYGQNGAGMSPADMQAAQSSVAAPTGLQQQSYNAAANMQVPGQFGTATDLSSSAGIGALGSVNQAGMYGQQGSQAGQQGAALSNMYGASGAMTGNQAGQMAGLYGQQGALAANQAAGISNLLGQQGVQTGQQAANTSSMYGNLGAATGAQAAGQSSMYGNLGSAIGSQAANTSNMLGQGALGQIGRAHV